VSRSIPEKTFEHWASMYVAHRFPRGSLWWPPNGEDVAVEDLGTVPGKAVLLELKVPEQQANGGHIVSINIPQLLRYLGRTVPVYYAFPEPLWSGDLIASGWLGPERRADLAYRRAKGRWFGEWTKVCSASRLHHILSPLPGVKTMQLPNPFPGGYSWTEFWRSYRSCGSRQVPSAFMVPEGSVGEVGLGDRIRREQLRNTLSGFRESTRGLSGASREQVRDSLRDAPRSIFTPEQPGSDSDVYRKVERSDINEDLRIAFGRDDPGAQMEGPQDLAICAVPFDDLDV
jgi:hypothetical protein